MGQKLCKAEIPEKFLLPQDATSLEASESRRLKKLVLRGKIAPFFPGVEEPRGDSQVSECPICFLFFRIMNRTRCCKQKICSSCYTKIKSKIQGSFATTSCPYCVSSELIVDICGPKTRAEREEEEITEQKLIEHRTRLLIESSRQSNEIISQDNEISEENNIIRRDVVNNEITSSMSMSMSINDDNLTPSSSLFTVPTETTNTTTTLERNHDLNERNGIEVEEDTSNAEEVSPADLISVVSATPSNVQEEYRQEYLALSSRNITHQLSNAEQHQCEEYLGVCPEDLGMQLEEFNELMLEQTLISSVIDRDIFNLSSNEITSHSSVSSQTQNQEQIFLSESNLNSNRERQPWHFSETDLELLGTQNNRNSVIPHLQLSDINHTNISSSSSSSTCPLSSLNPEENHESHSKTKINYEIIELSSPIENCDDSVSRSHSDDHHYFFIKNENHHILNCDFIVENDIVKLNFNITNQNSDVDDLQYSNPSLLQLNNNHDKDALSTNKDDSNSNIINTCIHIGMVFIKFDGEDSKHQHHHHHEQNEEHNDNTNTNTNDNDNDNDAIDDYTITQMFSKSNNNHDNVKHVPTIAIQNPDGSLSVTNTAAAAAAATAIQRKNTTSINISNEININSSNTIIDEPLSHLDSSDRIIIDAINQNDQQTVIPGILNVDADLIDRIRRADELLRRNMMDNSNNMS